MKPSDIQQGKTYRGKGQDPMTVDSIDPDYRWAEGGTGLVLCGSRRFSLEAFSNWAVEEVAE